MKKIACISFSIITTMLLISSFVFANDNNDIVDKQMQFYKNLKDCTKGEYHLGGTTFSYAGNNYNVKMFYTIYGIENNKCHFREVLGAQDMNCYLPMDMTKKYADEGIKTLQASITKGMGYSKYINQISNDTNYCKF